jgi:diguanylate cyclase (GGDEF)-like protein
LDNKNQSSNDMLEVRSKRHLRLCKILSFIGTAFLLVFGTISIKDQYFLLGATLLSCMIAGYINIYLMYKKTNIDLNVNVLNIILLILSLTLLITGGNERTGLFWIYPIIAINLFINRFWPAVFLLGVFLVISNILLFTPLSEFLLVNYSLHEAIRFEMTLLALCLICLAALHSEENAYKKILQMHDDDMTKLAYYDSLTGLPNRWSFKKDLTRILHRAKKEEYSIGLLYIDLDNFKRVNDDYGHEVGDQVLCIFSEKLKEVIRPTDMIVNKNFNEVARLAGDEFVVILNDLDEAINAGIVAERILNIFDGGLRVSNINHSVFASIGISIFPEDATTPDKLLYHSDLALYQAKKNGRNRFEFYTKEMTKEIVERHRIEDSLKLALEQNLFFLVYMPLFDCQSLKIVGIEVLLRCKNLEVNGIGPDVFIPIAEKTNLIKEIDLWVIENSMAIFIKLQSNFNFNGKLCINISGVEIQNELFPNKVKALLERYSISPSFIEFEITETAFILSNDKSISILNDLRKLGISIALDDFGTGYTAFNELIHYPADCLKIDRSFVNGLFSKHEARNKMVSIIKNLAELYELRVVAEGVETQKQLDYLQNIDCDWVQGYLLSPPLKLNDLENLLGNS